MIELHDIFFFFKKKSFRVKAIHFAKYAHLYGHKRVYAANGSEITALQYVIFVRFSSGNE